MSTADIGYGEHQVSAATARAHAELDTLVDAPVWSMTPAQVAATLPALTRLRARVTEPEVRVAQHASRVGLGSQSVPLIPPPGGPMSRT